MTAGTPELSKAKSPRIIPVSKRARRPEGTQPEVPDHEILRAIGTGSYGEVWLARSATGAYRAVKVVWREDFEDERTFTREFEGILSYEPIARGIPGLVHILHVGQKAGELPYYYYVMELADDAYTGIHIEPDDYVPRTLQSDMQLYGMHPMPLDYVLEVGSQLAHALAGLHAEDLTHRDIKPANVVFVNSRAKLADVGFVARGNKRSYVGTEGYIPPDGPGTPRADVYALAKVLYEMSTGKDRLDFPELPTDIPEGTNHRVWQDFNKIICAAAEPHVGKDSITSALVLADKLDDLRHFAPGARKKRRKPTKTAKSGNGKLYWLIGVLLVGFIVAAAAHFVPQDMRERVQLALAALCGQKPTPPPVEPVAPATPPGEASTAPEEISELVQEDAGIAPQTEDGQLFIATVPSGASVYTEDGQYLDETPYGPVNMPAGRQVSFILRKDGYADAHESGIIPKRGLLSLGGALLPYRPPQQGKVWQDALGNEYKPDKDEHKATQVVSMAQFEQFMQHAPQGVELRYETKPESDTVLTTQTGIGAYSLWLARQCRTAGILGRDHSLIAIAEPGTEAGPDMCAYRLCVTPIKKTPITVYSNPAGASVYFNGRLLGVTPMQDVRVPLAPYYLEVRMPGYSSVRSSGLSPRNLSLNLVLQANNSVSFGTEWINSMGLKLVPLSPRLLACSTEVRVADYHEYCEATGTPLPDKPAFEQNEHHPVVFVSRNDAENFARWLTEKERTEGLIENSDVYRLPTDAEWSAMAGLKSENGISPYEKQRQRSGEVKQDFPWGMRWPPYRDTGNFADTSAGPYTQPNHIIPHYRDDFPFTAPVGSFTGNLLGLHDMEGNVQEWVSGEYGGPEGFAFREYGVTRGGDYTSFRPSQLHSASRTPRPIDNKRPTVGFRLMLERMNQNL